MGTPYEPGGVVAVGMRNSEDVLMLLSGGIA
jgi:hypothetical protein